MHVHKWHYLSLAFISEMADFLISDCMNKYHFLIDYSKHTVKEYIMHTIVSEIWHATVAGYKLLKYKSSTFWKGIEKNRLMYVNENSKHHFVSSPLYGQATSQLYTLVYCRVVSKARFIKRFHEEYDIWEKKKYFLLGFVLW